MKTQIVYNMKKAVLLLTLILIQLLFSRQLMANEGQFYFTAKSAPLGASSQMGKSAQAVYLRWDLVEGLLPDDITRFELRRDDIPTPLLKKNIDDIMLPAEIHQMYAGEAEQQRLLQTVNSLQKLSLAQNQPFNASGFATELHDRLTNSDDIAWTFLASRQNFNIARARYRGYLDTEASGLVTYKLYVFNAQGNSALVGKVDVDTTSLTDKQVLPVSNFHQVEKTNCSITNAMEDHYTVILDWAAPGNTVTDHTASALQNGGYQIYRSTSNIGADITEVPVVNLAAKAATLGHDQRGNIKFTDLEPVNEFLIIAEGNDTQGQRQPAYFESPSQLKAAGLKPGDKRFYYIAPIDFAGHIGKTTGTIVQVPDRLKPATPWNIEFKQATGSIDRASLEWDSSTLTNYTAYYDQSRVICNAESAAVDGKIEYAASLEACNSVIHSRIDIETYLVYRFQTAQQSAGFSDADGDGFTDVDEKIAGSNACDDGSIPTDSTTKYLIKQDNYSAIDLANGRKKIRFNDTFLTQDENVGNTFWYRIASKTADGNISPLSAPIRGVFWDRVLPQKPTFTAFRNGNCCNLTTTGGGNWAFTDEVEQLGSLSLLFSSDSNSQTSPFNTIHFSDSESTLCKDKDSPIQAFWGKDIAGRELIYPGAEPGSLQQAYCQVAIPESMDLCKTGSWKLEKTSCEQPVRTGDIVDGPVQITVNAEEEGDCVTLWSKIAGQYTRVGSSCGTDQISNLVYEAEPGECLFAHSQDSSGNQSPLTEVVCTTTASSSPPSPPQVISFNAGTDSSDFSWRLPLEPTAITLVEISSDVSENQQTDSDFQLLSIPNAGFIPGNVFADTTGIHELIGARDQWCIRMKALAPVAQDAAEPLSSEWSNRLCSTRRTRTDQSKDYMPWPLVENVSVEQGFVVKASKDFIDSSLGMAYEKMPIIIPFASPALIALNNDGGVLDCNIHDRSINFDESDSTDSGLLLFGRNVTCPSLFSVEKLQLNKLVDLPFMVYRQARTMDGNVGKWVQVSPLINTIFWEFDLEKDNVTRVWTFNDPYFKFFRTSYNPASPWVLSFVDRYPHIAGYEYRYQIVSFTEEHAIDAIKISAGLDETWVKAAELGAMQ